MTAIEIEGVTARALFEALHAMPPAQRAYASWVMSKEALDRIKGLPEAERDGPIWGTPGYLFGKPIQIMPGAEGIELVTATAGPSAAKADHHASEAERLLKAAGKPVFRGEWPTVSTPEQALMRAGVHAALANYYNTRGEGGE